MREGMGWMERDRWMDGDVRSAMRGARAGILDRISLQAVSVAWQYFPGDGQGRGRGAAHQAGRRAREGWLG